MNITYVFAILIVFFVACKDKSEGNADDLSSIAYAPTSYPLSIPTSFPKMDIPADNPLTTEGVSLGRFLFYDKKLSANGSMSCASCHLPQAGFTDARAVSTGIDNIAGTRSSMSLENIGFVVKSGLFWDGRTKTLEEQALLPVEDPIELHNNWTQVVDFLKNHPEYPERFRRAFGIDNKQLITKELAAKALAQFERTLISGNAKIDKILRREEEFSDEEFAGWQLFFNANNAPDAQCGHCHTSPFFGSTEFFNNGLDSVSSLNLFKDKGRGGVTGKQWDNGKFRTPTLRNIELTAPYMHDGRFKTLEEVIEHYASGGHYADNIDPFIPQIKQIGLTTRQKKQILAFLKTLTDTSFTKNPKFQDPFK
jgi:cytochrome c peroxidase